MHHMDVSDFQTLILRTEVNGLSDLLAQFISAKVIISRFVIVLFIYFYFRAMFEMMPTALIMLLCIYFNEL